MLRFGSLEIAGPALLAPMSGITDRPFRRLIRRCNPSAVGLYTSEFISAEALWYNSQRSVLMMRSDPDEIPFAVQLFGRDLDRMLNAGEMAQKAGAQLVDINCGCPAPKVVKRGGGAALMREPEHFSQLVEAMVKTLSVPVTVKLRAGWDENSINAVEFARRAEDAGASAVAVHPRTRRKPYSGDADWSLVARVAKAISLPVIGSGDITTAKQQKELFQTSGCAAFMVGRGAIANPFVFRELAAARAGEQVPQAGKAERITLLAAYAELLAEDLPRRAHLGRLKNFANRMISPWETPELRRRLLHCDSPERLLDEVRRTVETAA